MTDTTMDNEFFEIADTFVNLANEHYKKVGGEKANAALIYAAARFNAFSVASESANIDEMKMDRQESKNKFMVTYEKHLDSNLNEYEDNYAQYLRR